MADDQFAIMSSPAPLPTQNTGAPVLSARWQDVVTVTWVVDATMIRSFVPTGTAIDHFQGKALISIVASHMKDVRWRGFQVPFLHYYSTLSLQTYVREQSHTHSGRAGTVVLESMVSRQAIALASTLSLGETMQTRRMRHVVVPDIAPETLAPDAQRSVVYEWYRDKEWERIVALTVGAPRPMRRESVEEFVTERQWRFTRHPSRPTTTYHIAHERWNITLLEDCLFEVDLETLYGPRFTDALSGEPVSSIISSGSTVTLHAAMPFVKPVFTPAVLPTEHR